MCIRECSSERVSRGIFLSHFIIDSSPATMPSSRSSLNRCHKCHELKPKDAPTTHDACPYSAPSAMGLIFTTIRLSFKGLLRLLRLLGFERVPLSRLPSSSLITTGGWRVASQGMQPSPCNCTLGNPGAILIPPRSSSSSRSSRSSSLTCELAGLPM